MFHVDHQVEGTSYLFRPRI